VIECCYLHPGLPIVAEGDSVALHAEWVKSANGCHGIKREIHLVAFEKHTVDETWLDFRDRAFAQHGKVFKENMLDVEVGGGGGCRFTILFIDDDRLLKAFPRQSRSACVGYRTYCSVMMTEEVSSSGRIT